MPYSHYIIESEKKRYKDSRGFFKKKRKQKAGTRLAVIPEVENDDTKSKQDNHTSDELNKFVELLSKKQKEDNNEEGKNEENKLEIPANDNQDKSDWKDKNKEEKHENNSESIKEDENANKSKNSKEKEDKIIILLKILEMMIFFQKRKKNMRN